MRTILNFAKKHVLGILVLVIIIALAVLLGKFPNVLKKVNPFNSTAQSLAVCQESNQLYLDLKNSQKKNIDFLDSIQRLKAENKTLLDSLNGLNKVRVGLKNEVVKLGNKLKVLKSKYNHLSGTDDYIFSMLKKCQQKKKVIRKRPVVKNITRITSVTRKDFAVAQYEGLVKGDYGVTIDKDGFLTYYLARRTFLSARPTIKIPAIPWNKHIVVVEQKIQGQEYYLATDTVHRVTRPEIDQRIVYHWAWYIGKNKDWGYGMYIPHELVKPAQEDTLKGIFKNGKGGAEFRSPLNYRVKQ